MSDLAIGFITGMAFTFIFALALIWRFVAKESKEQMEAHRNNQSHNWSKP